MSHRRHRPQFLSLAASTVALAVFAGVALADGRVDFRVLENGDQRVVIQANLTDYKFDPALVDGQSYDVVKVEREAPLLVAGAPDLVQVSRSIMLPPTGDVRIRVDEAASSYFDITDIDIAPSKGNLYRDRDPADTPYSFDNRIYATDAYYPGKLAELGTPYVMREARGVVATLYPFQYNPVRRSLRIYTTLTATVDFIGGRGENEIREPVPDLASLAFEDIYAQHFVNYDSGSRYAPLNEQGDLLIICHDAWLPNIAPLVAHKNAIGINTVAVGVSTIGNTSTAIKNYIQNRYNQGGLAFVLLVGDSAQVATPTASGGSSDPSYAKLAGNDNYPDIMVGRFSAETAAQVDTQVLRTVEYEQLNMVNEPWYKKGVGIASSQGAGIGDDGEADYVHMDNLRALLLNQGGYTTVDQIYDTNGGTAAMVTNALNQGRGVINYCGHGSTTSWSTTGFSNSHINALTNHNKLPFIHSVACVNGQFAGLTCFAEAWLRATNAGEPTGAVAAYMSSINQSWAPPMEAQDEFVDLIVDPAQPYHCVGTLFFASSCAMLDKYGAGAGGAGTEMYDTWHCFGDPSLRVIGLAQPPSGLAVEPPGGFEVVGDVGGPFTPSQVTYTLRNFDATPLNFTVSPGALWLKAEPPAGTIPPNGTLDVTIRIHRYARNYGVGQQVADISFVNASGGPGTTTRRATLKIGVPTRVYYWPLDSNPGWTVEGQWAYGDPLGQGGGTYGNPDPQNGYTGTNVYGVNLAGNYNTTAGGPYNLTSTPFDCTGMSQIELRYRRWLNSDYDPYVTNKVEFSTNGTTWNQLWTNGSTEYRESQWSLQSHGLSPLADDKATVYLRWSYKIGSGAWPYSGWNVDDIEVWALAPQGPAVCYGDANCDGVIDFLDIDAFIEALSYPGGQGWPNACSWIHSDVDGDDNVTFFDIDPFIEMLGLPCP